MDKVATAVFQEILTQPQYEKVAMCLYEDIQLRTEEKLASFYSMEKDAAPVIDSNTIAKITGGSNNDFMSRLKGFFKGKNTPITSTKASVGTQYGDMSNYITSRMGTPYKIPENSKFTSFFNKSNPNFITKYEGSAPRSAYTVNPQKVQGFEKGNISGMPMTKTNPIMTGMFNADKGSIDLMQNRAFNSQTPTPVNYNW